MSVIDPFTVRTETLLIGDRQVEVSQMTAAGMLAVQRAGADNRIIALVAACVTVDGQGFDPDQVMQWPASTLNQIVPTVLRLNGLEAEAPAEGESAEGNDPAAAAA